MVEERKVKYTERKELMFLSVPLFVVNTMNANKVCHPVYQIIFIYIFFAFF